MFSHRRCTTPRCILMGLSGALDGKHGRLHGVADWHNMCMHACIHAYIHTYIRTYVHTYIHTYIFPASEASSGESCRLLTDLSQSFVAHRPLAQWLLPSPPRDQNCHSRLPRILSMYDATTHEVHHVIGPSGPFLNQSGGQE